MALACSSVLLFILLARPLVTLRVLDRSRCGAVLIFTQRMVRLLTRLATQCLFSFCSGNLFVSSHVGSLLLWRCSCEYLCQCFSYAWDGGGICKRCLYEDIVRGACMKLLRCFWASLCRKKSKMLVSDNLAAFRYWSLKKSYWNLG